MQPTDSIAYLPRSGSSHFHASLDPTTTVLESVFLNMPTFVRDKVYSHVIGVKRKIYVSRKTKLNADQLIFKHCQSDTEAGDQPNCVVRTRATTHVGRHALDTALSFTCRKIHDEILRYLCTYHHLILCCERIKVFDLAAQFGTYTRNIRVLSLHHVFLTDYISDHDLQSSRGFAIGLNHLKSLTVHGIILAAATRHGSRLHEEGFMNWFRPLAILPLQHAEVHLNGFEFLDNNRDLLLRLEERAVAILLKGSKLLEEQQVARPTNQLDARRDTLKNREAAIYHPSEGSIITRSLMKRSPQESWFKHPAHRAQRRRRVSL